MQTRDEVEGLHNYCQVFISGYVDYVNTEKKIFYCLYKLTLPRKKQQNSLLWHWLKEKFLQVAKSCTRNLARIISSCFAKKAAFQNTDFSRLKCQLKRKSWHITFGKIFQPTREWVNKVNLSSFQPKNFFKFVLSCSLRTADVSPCSSPLRDVSRGETSATQWQKFYTDVNHCLHNKSCSHGVPNANLFNFTFLLVDFGKVLCSSANELQQNSNASSREDYIPQILTVLLEIHRVYIWPLPPFVFCLSFVINS